MNPQIRRLASCTLLLTLVVTVAAPVATPDHTQNDAGSNADAGDTRATATPVTPFGIYTATLSGEASDRDDYYSFSLTLGDELNLEIRDALTGGFLPSPDNNKRLGVRLLDQNGVLLDTPNTNQGDTRVTLTAAPYTGTYYLHITNTLGGFTGDYRFCFVVFIGGVHSCPDIGMRPIAVFGGGSPEDITVRVLIVPPAHGDLGNPLTGPSALDYLAASIDAIHQWESSIADFTADYPAYNYLDMIDIDVQIFDPGVTTVAVYDIVITYIETSGTQFRGVATPCINPPRCVVLSLFASSPRGGQLIPDYPEINDLKAVVMHEFAHAFGVGHSLTWDATHGPDLMNSPATFVYGDGDPLGDGGERTPAPCPSTLDLYALAEVYAWLMTLPLSWAPPSASSYSLPGSIPYDRYC